MKHATFKIGFRCRRLMALLLSGVLVFGGASFSLAGQQQSSAGEAKTTAPSLTQIYRVGPDDVLEIRLLNDAKAQQDYRISPGGYIFFDYVGNVSVAGKTTSEIEEELKRLLKSGYFENPEVTVAVKDYKSHAVYLLGESANNQVVLKHERELLFEILVKSGVRQSARRVVITRMVDGQPTMVQVDLTTNEKYTTLVQHGDIIEVQAASSDKVFLTGEVKTIGTIEYTTGLTLSQAIILAGGTSEFAKRSKIEVRRKSSTGKPEIIKANLDNIIRGKDPDIELKPNDTIYVPRRFL